MAVAGQLAFKSAKIAAVEPAVFVGKLIVTWYLEFVFRLVANLASLSKYKLFGDPNVMPNWFEVVPALGVARISAMTADKIFAATVCELAF